MGIPDFCIHFDDAVSREERKAVNKQLTELNIDHWYDTEAMKSSGFMPAPPLAIITCIYVKETGKKLGAFGLDNAFDIAKELFIVGLKQYLSLP